ncbi:MAG: hypothetical protein JW869_00980 [Candidatus Omnitrophica bacterium]|nr:hypothetical protein [Candidatus Omnitrophota bacterium]
MLKRYQVLLNDWQAEHYKLMSRKYDVSFSEMIRMALCLDIIYATYLAFPKQKLTIDAAKLKRSIKARNIIDAMTSEEFHNFLSKVYFEARKATEVWSKSEKEAEE